MLLYAFVFLLLGSSVCVADHADLVSIVPLPFVLSAIFVDVVPSFVVVAFVVVVVNIDVSGGLLCTKSVLSLFLTPFPNLV